MFLKNFFYFEKMYGKKCPVISLFSFLKATNIHIKCIFLNELIFTECSYRTSLHNLGDGCFFHLDMLWVSTTVFSSEVMHSLWPIMIRLLSDFYPPEMLSSKHHLATWSVGETQQVFSDDHPLNKQLIVMHYSRCGTLLKMSAVVSPTFGLGGRMS